MIIPLMMKNMSDKFILFNTLTLYNYLIAFGYYIVIRSSIILQ